MATKEIELVKPEKQAMHVLVVEDNPTQSTLLRLHLQKLGFGVDCVMTLASGMCLNLSYFQPFVVEIYF